MQELEKLGDFTKANQLLENLQKTIYNLEISEELKAEILSKLSPLNITQNNWKDAWAAIKKVWGSKFNQRVFTSTLKSKISLRNVYMSVLC